MMIALMSTCISTVSQCLNKEYFISDMHKLMKFLWNQSTELLCMTVELVWPAGNGLSLAYLVGSRKMLTSLETVCSQMKIIIFFAIKYPSSQLAKINLKQGSC